MAAAPVCVDDLRKIYDAIMALSSGKSVTSISFGERSVAYTASQMKDLQTLYRTFYRTCGVDSGLPDLSATAAVERGAPVQYRGI